MTLSSHSSTWEIKCLATKATLGFTLLRVCIASTPTSKLVTELKSLDNSPDLVLQLGGSTSTLDQNVQDLDLYEFGVNVEVLSNPRPDEQLGNCDEGVHSANTIEEDGASSPSNTLTMTIQESDSPIVKIITRRGYDILDCNLLS